MAPARCGTGHAKACRRCATNNCCSGGTEGIDRYHLLERLAGALQIVEPNAGKRHGLLDEWREGFARRNSTVDEVERFFLDEYRRLNDTDPEQRDRLWEHLVFLANHKQQMRYVTLRQRRPSSGSGVTESSAKTVIGQRAKGSGQRWREDGLRGVLTLRALHQSERFPKFWSHFSRRYNSSRGGGGVTKLHGPSTPLSQIVVGMLCQK